MKDTPPEGDRAEDLPKEDPVPSGLRIGHCTSRSGCIVHDEAVEVKHDLLQVKGWPTCMADRNLLLAEVVQHGLEISEKNACSSRSARRRSRRPLDSCNLVHKAVRCSCQRTAEHEKGTVRR